MIISNFIFNRKKLEGFWYKYSKKLSKKLDNHISQTGGLRGYLI